MSFDIGTLAVHEREHLLFVAIEDPHERSRRLYSTSNGFGVYASVIERLKTLGLIEAELLTGKNASQSIRHFSVQREDGGAELLKVTELGREAIRALAP